MTTLERKVKILRSWMVEQTEAEKGKSGHLDQGLNIDELCDKIDSLSNSITDSQITLEQGRLDSLPFLWETLDKQTREHLEIYRSEVTLYTTALELIKDLDPGEAAHAPKKREIEGKLERSKKEFSKLWHIKVFCDYLTNLVPKEVKPALEAYRKAGRDPTTDRNDFYSTRANFAQATIKAMESKYGASEISAILQRMDIFARMFIPIEDSTIEHTDEPYERFTTPFVGEGMGIGDVKEDDTLYFTEFSGYFIVPKNNVPEFEVCLADAGITQESLHYIGSTLFRKCFVTRKLLPGYDNLPDEVNGVVQNDLDLNEGQYTNNEWSVYKVFFDFIVPEAKLSEVEAIAHLGTK